MPTPPGETSPSIMFDSGTAPPSALKLSCIELTAPVEVPVVAPAKSADQAMPKRCSLPSIEPERAARRPRARPRRRAPGSSTRRPAIVAVATMPWRRLPTIRP